MNLRCIVLYLLLASVAFAQAAPSSNPQEQPGKPAGAQAGKPAQPPASAAPKAAKPQESTTPQVPENAPVITLNGMCETKAGVPKPADCKTIVTRAEFERMLSALTTQPLAQIPPPARQQAANKIAQLMILSNEAEKMGVQNKPETQELLRYARMTALSQELGRTLQEKFAHSSPDEIQKYYAENQPQFTEAHVVRVFIPKPRPEDNKPVDENAFKATAEKIRQEAVSGADFDKLQKEAFDGAGVKSAAPPTDLGTVKLADAPQAHKQIFELKPGEISQLIADPSGFYVYKIVSKRVVPVTEAKDEIEKSLAAKKLENAAQQITSSTQAVLNPAYFGEQPGVGPGAEKVPPSHAAKPATRPQTQTRPPATPPK